MNDKDASKLLAQAKLALQTITALQLIARDEYREQEIARRTGKYDPCAYLQADEDFTDLVRMRHTLRRFIDDAPSSLDQK